jgi:serine/threonine-protein kinase
LPAPLSAPALALAAETHTSLAVLWSGPGLAQSALVVSSLGLRESGDEGDPSSVADTVIAKGGPYLPPHGPETCERSPSLPGQRLGRFRLIERLGRGCQGDVWRAVAIARPGIPLPSSESESESTSTSESEEDPAFHGGEEVALKLLPPRLARDPRRLAQFRREAERRARLAVPSVLPTTEMGEANGIPFMVMPLVDGCSLAEIVAWRRRDGLRRSVAPDHPLADAEDGAYVRGMVQVLARVARTLDHVHASSVAHRDIKPANILLDRHREEGVFLCDFGLARDLDVATREQLRDGAGTPLYMPPERLLRLDADEFLCDVYSLGATLYEAVTLVPPVQIPESLPWSAWTSYLASARPVRPRSVRPELPESLEAIILRAMAHEPDRRHPGAARLADDLERFLGVAAPQEPPAPRRVLGTAV